MPKRKTKKQSRLKFEIGGLGDNTSSIDGSHIDVLPNARTSWSGYVEVSGRTEKIWTTFHWVEGPNTFADAECHEQLGKIAELFMRKGEKLEYILLGVHQTNIVISTAERCLRDLLTLNPPTISIVYSRGGRVKGFTPFLQH
jgi:hypothetical protein